MIVYWIYFSIFLIAVLVPAIIRGGYSVFPEEQIEQLAILLLGFLGFLLFIAQRKKALQYIKEKAHFVRETSRMSKDLTSSYSYIGEINRKLDILKNIALGLPEAAAFTPQKEKEIYDLIMGAIRVLGKSQLFAIKFIKVPEGKILKEINSRKNVVVGMIEKECLQSKHIIEKEDSVIVTSHRAIDNVIACILIKKQKKSYAHDDLELIEAIASQALFVFISGRNKRKGDSNDRQKIKMIKK